MSRLTKKDYKDWWHPVGAIINEQSSIYLNEVNHKLGKLEDLEQELGCPLEVVFKAIEHGVYFSFGVKGYKEFMKPTNLFLKFSLGGFHCLFFKHFNNDCEIDLQDYKKTWWLKEDLEEQDEK